MRARHVLVERPALESRIAEMAREIRRDAPLGAQVHLIAVLKGAFMFLSDLMRAMDGPVSCDFMAVSSYGPLQTSSGEVRVTKDLDHSIEGRDVVIVEDIVDTGRTLSYLQGLLRARSPRSLRTACLLDKRSRRQTSVVIDYVGFVIPDRFVVGYGLDLDEQYRNLSCIALVDAAEGPQGALETESRE
jgi:hypoxanthine phosphoribosyltransferase